MGQVSASSTVLIDAEPEPVLAAARITRPCARRSSPRTTGTTGCSKGGQGAGTVAMWKLQATNSWVRDVKANVDVAGHTSSKGTPT
jgi:hypothetical protein